LRVNVVAGAAGGSTIVTVSTGSVRVQQSSAADLVANVNLRDGSSNLLESSTSGPSTGARGLFVRQILNNLQSIASTNAFASTVFSLVSSHASLRGKAYAYIITTTNTTPTRCGFYSGTTLRWAVKLQAMSSAVIGAAGTVSPPAWLFHSDTGAALTFNTSGSTQAGWHVSVAYFQEA
jgi:hypothetical protein